MQSHRLSTKRRATMPRPVAANLVHDQDDYIEADHIGIDADFARLRRLKGIDGLDFVRLAMAEVVAANRVAMRLVKAGGLCSKDPRRTVNALRRRGLRVAALEAMLTRFPAVEAALIAERIKARQIIKEAG